MKTNLRGMRARKAGIVAATVVAVLFVSVTTVAAISDYDANGDGYIQRDEVLAAIDDYLFNGSPTRTEVIDLIEHYLFDIPVEASTATPEPTATPTPTPVPQPENQCHVYDSSITWLERPHENYSVCYTQEYAQDVEFVERWIDHAEELMRDKYDVDLSKPRGRARLHVNVLLLPEPNDDASTGTANFSCCYDASGQRDWRLGEFGQIRYLAPSHPDWQRGTTWGRMRLPRNDFHAKRLVHEFTHAAQRAIWGGSYTAHGGPTWFMEGLAEYEGMFNSTEYNRTDGFESLVRYMYQIQDEVFCCQTLEDDTLSLHTRNVYFGGAFIMKFLADTYGEDIHARLLRHPDPFADALTAELEAAGASVPEAFKGLNVYLDQKARR